MAGYAYARDFHPNWQANTSQRMQISRIICQSSPGWPRLPASGPRGHFNRPSFTIVSLLRSFSRVSFLSLFVLHSPISMRFSIHPSIHSPPPPPPPPFFPLQSVGRVSRLKRHLLIVATFAPLSPFFPPRPLFFAFSFQSTYIYIYTHVSYNTRCSNWKLIFESIGER